jgi:probable HAF family extracellular repeat protein
MHLLRLLWIGLVAVLCVANGAVAQTVAVDLGTLGGTAGQAAAVNSSGQVAGSSTTASGEFHAFAWTAAGGMVDLGTLGGTYSEVVSINETGQVVWWSATSGRANFARSRGQRPTA